MDLKFLLKLAVLLYLVIFILFPMLGSREKMNGEIVDSVQSNLQEKSQYRYADEYVAITPVPTKAPIPVQTSTISTSTVSMTFDVEIETGYILYNKGGCTIILTKYTNIGDKDAESGKCTSDDWENIKKKLTVPKPTIKVESTPISKVSDSNLEKPFDNPWDFILYAQKNWRYVEDSGKTLLQPTEYFRLMEGDCDDFAIMIAYYLQEVYGYDTKIVVVQQPEGLHMVAFLAADDNVIQGIADNCEVNIPTLEFNNVKYIAIDWKICPGWSWTNPGTEIISREWSYYVGMVI